MKSQPSQWAMPGLANEAAALVDSGSYTVSQGAKAAANRKIPMIRAPAAPSG